MSRKPNPTERRRLRQIVASDPEIMEGTPVFRGTRIPVDLIADMPKVPPRKRSLKAIRLWTKRGSRWRLWVRGRSQLEKVPTALRGPGKSRKLKGPSS